MVCDEQCKCEDIRSLKCKCKWPCAILKMLPVGFQAFESLNHLLEHDEERELLIFKGIMTEEERDMLLNSSSNGPFKEAVRIMFDKSEKMNNSLENPLGEEECNKNRKELYSLDLSLKEIREYDVEVNMRIYRDYYNDKVYNHSVAVKPDFDELSVSYFEMPFIDNTRLGSCNRFALILHYIHKKNLAAEIGEITFPEEFMSLRDRPYFTEMLKKLNKGGTEES
ncbi:MAG: hypothetical protein SWO11_23455 [Thermodesulfobacteriota bacterium]|nr:hypothetical protein [Thermodesulfobacteriota bacterium]